MYRSASHTGDAVIRGMYSSVSVGVVHVLCACAQVQSKVWCSCHTAACNHLTTHFLSRLLVRLVVVVVVVAAAVVVQLIFAFLWTPKNRQLVAFSHIFETRGEKKTSSIPMFFAPRKPKKTRYLRGGVPLVAKITVFTVFLCQRLAKHWYLRIFHHVARWNFYMRKGHKHCI